MEISLSPHEPDGQDPRDRVRRIKAFFSLIFNYGINEANSLVEIRSLEEAEAVLVTIRSWNTFDHKKVMSAVKGAWPDIMGLHIGCEGSPVMYIEVPYWIGQKHESGLRKLTEEETRGLLIACKGHLLERSKKIHELTGDHRLTEEEQQTIVKKVVALFNFTSPTEVDYEERHHHVHAPHNSIRIWWD